jgi:hypothetical protein
VSPLPGVTYEERDAAGSSGAPLDTATAFVGGLAEKGPTDKPVFVSTPSKYLSVYGEEFAPGYLYDAERIIREEGGAGGWFIRVVGPGAKVSTVKLTDGTGNTLRVDAVNPGAWGDDIDVVTAVASGNVTYTVKYRDAVVETSPALATNAEAVAWSQNSEYVRFVDLGGGDPTAQSVSLAGGTDDRANITDEHRIAALALFTADLGPGQVLWPGATTTAMHTALLEHGRDRNRTALLDGADTATVATLTGQAATLRALGASTAHCGGMFAPWATVPGPAPSQTKPIPYSIIQAGLCARRDLQTVDGTLGIGNPNDPAAGTGENAGVSRVATGLSQPAWTSAQRETLNEAGVNVARVVYERVVTFGYRTLTNPVTDKVNEFLNNRRIDMAIIAAEKAIAEEFDLRQVDGRGRKLSELKSQIIGRVLQPYLELGALFESKEGAEDAYSVTTDEQINPPKQLAEGEVVVETKAKRSPLAEQVKLIYVKEAL